MRPAIIRGAVQGLEVALGIFRDLDNRLGQANVLANLGIVRRLTGDYTAAVQVLGEALDTYRDLGDRSSAAETLNESGHADAWRGQCGPRGPPRRRAGADGVHADYCGSVAV